MAGFTPYKQYSADELVFDAKQTQAILQYFYPDNKSQFAEVDYNAYPARNLAQNMLVKAVEGSNAMSVIDRVNTLFNSPTVLTKLPALNSVAKELLKESKHLFDNKDIKHLEDIKIYDAIRQDTAYHLRGKKDELVNGINNDAPPPEKQKHSALEPGVSAGATERVAFSSNPEVQALNNKLHDGLADKITQAGGGKWLEPMLAQTTYDCLKKGINANNIGYMDISIEKNNILVMSQNKHQFVAVNATEAAKVDPQERSQAADQLCDTMQQQKTLAMAQQPEYSAPSRSV